jgi:hypothetical protein
MKLTRKVQQQLISEGWTIHDGKDLPKLPLTTRVQIMYTDGETSHSAGSPGVHDSARLVRRLDLGPRR